MLLVEVTAVVAVDATPPVVTPLTTAVPISEPSISKPNDLRAAVAFASESASPTPSAIILDAIVVTILLAALLVITAAAVSVADSDNPPVTKYVEALSAKLFAAISKPYLSTKALNSGTF